MTEATAILIVHGGYFLPQAWAPFTTALIQAGFTVRCPRLPTCADDTPASQRATLEDDVQVVQQTAVELREQGHAILVLAHSYGGVVASEAIIPSLYHYSTSTSPTNSNENGNENENENEKEKGGVVSLIYLAAFLIPPSTTVVNAMTKHNPASHVRLGLNDNDGTVVYAQNAAEAFYNDLPPAKAEELARSNVTHNIAAAVTHTVRNAPWMDLRTVYIQCARDRALVFELQQILVDDAVATAAAAAVNKKQVILEKVTLDSGHCPFLSRPDEVLDIIRRVAREN